MGDLETMFRLDGRVALVTGATGTLGLNFARTLHQAGAAVALAARRPERLQDEAAKLGDRVVAVGMDVTNEDSVRAGFAQAEERLGVCDVIVNNAGIAVSKRFLEQTVADWDSVTNVDLRGAFIVAREGAGRLVKAKKPGCIINISSILGLRVLPGVASYTASKAGLAHLTRAMAVELARYDIRVNALAPGYIATEINREYFESESGRAMVKRIPQRRLGKPEELSGPLLLLASQAGSHMTGAVVVVDGGHSVASL